MYSRFRPITKLISQEFRTLLKTSRSADFTTYTKTPFISLSIPIRHFHQTNPNKLDGTLTSTDDAAFEVQSLLKLNSLRNVDDIEQHLSEINLPLSEDLILEVLKRHGSDWKSAYVFFNWVRKSNISAGFSPTTSIYNEILDILGRMKQFEDLFQVLDEMLSRKNLINERTYAIVVNRFCAAHKVDEAIEFFHNIEKYFGLERNLVAFQSLLYSMCRYKHVEAAELLFRNEKSEFRDDIKTWNIILNGWCVLGSLRDAKRFWKDTVTNSMCKPDKFTLGIFINALSKSGKISTAKKLLKKMWAEGFKPDVVICNAVIDGLCFKKRIPEAIEIFLEMNERDCPPNVGSYNTLIKHLCKIRRMEKVEELLKEMENVGGTCLPNSLTYVYLMKAAKNPEEVEFILEKIVKSGCSVGVDIRNMMLRLFMEWGDEKRVKCVLDEMERSGEVPDERSYTVMVHGLYDKGLFGPAMEFFSEMISKGMVPEPRTLILVDEMKYKLNGVNTSGV